MKGRVVLTIAGILLATSAWAQTEGRFIDSVRVGGTISRDTTWTAGPTIIVVSDITVPSGVTLTVQAGAIIKVEFRPGGIGLFTIRGALDLQGTASSPVYFTSVRDDDIGGDLRPGDPPPASGDWGGILYYNGNNRLHHAIVKYGGHYEAGPFQMVMGWHCSPRLDSSCFAYSYSVAIAVEYRPATVESVPSIRDNTILHCRHGIAYGSNCFVKVEIKGNSVHGTDAFESFGIGGDGLAAGSVITCDTVQDFDRGIQLVNCSPLVSYNTVISNSWGIQTSSLANPNVHHNNIAGNTRYGLRNSDTTLIVTARHNWWGSPRGPSAASHPDGDGDSVSGRVDYSDWLRYPPSPGPDVATYSILAPSGIARYDTVLTPSAVVCNSGTDTADFTVRMRIGAAYSQTVAASLLPEQWDTIAFPTWTARPRATLVVQCSTLYATDGFPENDAQQGSVAVDSGQKPLITGITPNRGGNTGCVTVTITGRRFQPGASVKLTRTGQPDIVVDTFWTWYPDSSRVRCVLGLKDQQMGDWDVAVTNPDSSSAVFHGGFAVERGIEELATEIIGQDVILVGRPQTYRVTCTNSGNVDMLICHLSLQTDSGLRCLRAVDVDGGGQTVFPDSGYWVGAPDSCTRGPVILVLPALRTGQSRSYDVTLYADPWLDSSDQGIGFAAAAEGMGGELGMTEAADFLAMLCLAKLEEGGGGMPDRATWGHICRRAVQMYVRTWTATTPQEARTRAVNYMIGSIGSAVSIAAPPLAGWAAGATAVVTSIVSGNVVYYWDNLWWWLRRMGKSPRTALTQKRIEPRRSIDPNAKAGPTGSGSSVHFVSSGSMLDYIVHFENVDSATAPAETIVVADRLDGSLNWNTLEFGSVSHPSVCSTFIDTTSGTVEWMFKGINLPPNRNPPEGEGWCRFSIMPRVGLPSGAQIRNSADIVFDQNPAMSTDTVLNTIDAGPPTSSVHALPETTIAGEFTVRWPGQDDNNGSGVRYYDVYVKTDTGPYVPWLTETSDTAATFVGVNESWHYFYSIATDNVGWREAAPAAPDAHTFVNGVAPPLLLLPTDTSFTNDSTPAFVWSKTVGTGGTYKLQYAYDSLFTRGLVNVPGLTDTTYTLPDSSALRDSLYYWHVEAYGRLGTPSGFRQPSKLTVDTRPPASPVLVTPPDSALVSDSTPTFVWLRVPSADRYYIEYATDTLFDTLSLRGLGAAYDTAFTVPDRLALDDSTYFWHVEALDRAGNPSGFQSHAFRFTVAQLRSVSGNAAYYRGSLLGIPSTDVILSGAMADTVQTDSAGDYLFQALMAHRDYVVAPERRSPAREPAVSAFDAAMVLQHAVHQDTLDSLQFIAADVTGDSTVSAMDAANILQYAVAMRRHFPVGYRPGLDTVDWAFRPPQRFYDSLVANQSNQDYKSILYGDPSGNWPGMDLLLSWGGVPDGGPCAYYELNMPRDGSDNDQATMPIQGPRHNAQEPALAESGEPKGLSGAIPRLVSLARNDVSTYPPQAEVGTSSAEVVFPVVTHRARDMVSADALVRYDTERYTLRGIRTTEQTAGFMVAAADRCGYVRIGMAGTRELNGDVALLELVFGPAGQTAKDAKSAKPGAVQAPKTEDLTSDGHRGQEAAPTSKAVSPQPSAVSGEPLADIVWLVLNEGASDAVDRTGEGAMGDEKKLPASFYLAPPKPNPFGTGTRISYGLPAASEVGLAVFDAAGRRVRTLVGGRQSAGRYSVLWNGCDDSGRRMANGVYFVRLKTPAQRFQRKVALARG